MPLSKQLGSRDKKTTRSFLNQLIDILQEDICNDTSRKKYQVFVTGGLGPGVTSSLFQTVFDQDFTLQTANPLFDITVGLAPPDAKDDGIAAGAYTAIDSGGKYLYPSQTLMMREKTDVYSQFAQMLLGNASTVFTLPTNASTDSSSTTTTDIDAAMFIAFKRLFARDQIKTETYAMKMNQTASIASVANLYITSTLGSAIFTDIGMSNQKFFDASNPFGYLVDASKTSVAVGKLYYNQGIAVVDMNKAFESSQKMTGTIDAAWSLTGETIISSSFSPNFVCSGSIDNIVDHICEARFGCSSNTAITFQNVTNINSTLVFCRALPDDFNYSSNPTYVEAAGTTNEGRLTIYDPAVADELQEPFAYVTTIGLYDAAGGLLAVAKLSRPVEKSAARDLTFRVRLDF